MSVEQSKASAMMEAIERYCGQKFPHHGVIHACCDDVIDYALHPSKFKFPSQPPKCRDCPDKDWDCHQELHNICMEWSWGYSLTHRRPALIPAALIYYPYISDDNTSFMFNDTGGLAAGNIIEEAILQGIAEVIERDAHYAAFNLGTLKNSPILNFKGTTNRYITRFIHESLPHEKIFAFEINHEMHQHHIPAFSALICYRLGDNIYYFGGSGANLDPEIALLRALTELEQQKVRQKAYLEFDRSHLVTQNTAGASHTAYIEDYPARSSGNIKKDIELCVDRLSRNDMDIMVVNLTHPEIGIPVVRVIIPQLISYSGHPIEESFLKQMINLTD
jgi:ribosomal protein S12 methylthiotransferase accessory factor